MSEQTAGRSPFAAFARFVLIGGGTGLASGAAVPLAATLMPWVTANALITVLSTLLGTELHARFTFGARRRAHWHEHLQSAGSATAAYLVTSAAVLVLHVVQPAAGAGREQAVYLAASGLAGAGRFLLLRLLFLRAQRTGRPPGCADAVAARPGRVVDRRAPRRARRPHLRRGPRPARTGPMRVVAGPADRCATR
jgi:putative flippase GtrA